MVLVEYLYQNARHLMVYRRFPVYVLLIVIFYADAHLRELPGAEGNEGGQHSASIFMFIVNILITLFELFNIGLQLKLQK